MNSLGLLDRDDGTMAPDLFNRLKVEFSRVTLMVTNVKVMPNLFILCVDGFPSPVQALAVHVACVLHVVGKVAITQAAFKRDDVFGNRVGFSNRHGRNCRDESGKKHRDILESNHDESDRESDREGGF